MFTYLQAIILGLLQGITELFPISSLGHSVILPRLLGWDIHQSDPFFLNFLIATHLATALVLFIFFYQDWLKIIAGVWRSLTSRRIDEADIEAKLGWLIIVGSIPAGIIGLLFEEKIRALFASPILVAGSLAANGILLFAAEFLRHKNQTKQASNNPDQPIAQLSWGKTLVVGSMQALALIPGFSRTGAAITGGLWVGLEHESAARFSFLLATPIIGAAALLKLPEMAASSSQSYLGQTLVGAMCSAVAAYIAVKFLTRYFETNTLKPFAIYCLIAGLASLVLLLGR
jgi:undecaprenyl-diphosphatase